MIEKQKEQVVKLLAEKLGLSDNESLHKYLDDLSGRNKLREVLLFYDSIQNPKEKFVLMEVLVKVANDHFKLHGKIAFWGEIEQRLIWDFDIHRQIVKDWACSGTSAQNLSGPIIQDMIELWDRSKQSKTRILFVCTINMMRSATAHYIYSNDLRFEVQSAGTLPSARTVISKKLLDWAEVVVVMEDHHQNFIRKMYPGIVGSKTIFCLDVPDKYDYMDDELVILLRARFEDLVRRGIPF